MGSEDKTMMNWYLGTPVEGNDPADSEICPSTLHRHNSISPTQHRTLLRHFAM